MEPFQVAAVILALRVPLNIISLAYVKSVRLRPLYFVTSIMCGLGSLIYAAALVLRKYGLVEQLGEAFLIWTPLAGIMLFYAGISLGSSQICFALPSEILPQKTRSQSSGVLNFLHGISLFVVVEFFPYIEIYLGMDTAFFILAISAFLSTAMVYFYVPETRGKSLNEIEEYYKKFSKKTTAT